MPRKFGAGIFGLKQAEKCPHPQYTVLLFELRIRIHPDENWMRLHFSPPRQAFCNPRLNTGIQQSYSLGRGLRQIGIGDLHLVLHLY